MLQKIFVLVQTYQLPLLIILGMIGVAIYLVGSRQLAKLRSWQLDQMHLHPDEPVPDLPAAKKQGAIAFEIAGFIILSGVCLAMLLLGHFDKYLALFGIG